MKSIQKTHYFKRLLPLFLAAALVLLPACSGAKKPAPTASSPVSVAEGSFADGTGMSIAFKLLYALQGMDAANSVVGTAGLAQVLAAVKSGSANGTDTALGDALGMQNMAPKDISDIALALRETAEKFKTGKFTTAWALFVGNDQPVKESFLSETSQSLKLQTKFQPMDGEKGLEYIDEWADEATGGIVKKVGFSLPKAKQPFFVDLFSADPDWQKALDKGKTRPLSFIYEDGEDKAVPTMVLRENCGVYSGVDGAMAVLPCAGDELRVVIMVPPEKTALKDFIPIAAAQHDAWMDAAEWNDQRVLLPRFAAGFSGSAMDLLNRAGIGALLAKNRDYSALGEGLYFCDVLHMAELTVDESGVDGPDPSAVYRPGMKDDIPTLAVNRPFLVLLEMPNTHEVLAAGFVRDPLTAKLD